MGPCVRVRLDHHPRGRIRHPEVQNLARRDESVKPVHDLLDAGGEVPPVHVEKIDVVGLQLPEAVVDGDAQRLEGVADVVGLNVFLVKVCGAKARRVFGRDAVQSDSDRKEEMRLIRAMLTPSDRGSHGLSSTHQSIPLIARTGNCWHWKS